MKRFLLLCTGLAALWISVHGEPADDVRFSRTLARTEWTGTGLDRLDSDQIAVLDALVRREIAATRFVAREPRARDFSARLSADERRNAGLSLLNATEIAQLDALAARVIPRDEEDDSTVATSAAPAAPIGVKVNVRRGPEFHGFVSLTIGAGSGGYSEVGGALYVETQPIPNLTIGVGYAESRIKGDYLCGPYSDYYWGRRDALDRAVNPIR